MHVVAVHSINDPQRFYSSVQEGMKDIPEGMHVKTMAPSTDGSRAVCVWQADSVDSVRSLVEGSVGDSSHNEFFEVRDENAIGLSG